MSWALEDVIKIKLPGTRKRKSLRDIFADMDKTQKETKQLIEMARVQLDGEDKWFVCEKVDNDDNTLE